MFEVDRDRSGRAAPAPPAPDRARPTQRAWRTLSPVWATQGIDALSPVAVERLRPQDLHTDRNSDAEYAFYRLAGRFQRYADEYLFADERILAFAPWSAAVSDTWRHRLGRWVAPGGRTAREGALIVTDRQVFLIRDDAEVAAGGLAWGYLVQATTLERLEAVDVAVDRHGHVELRLALAAANGREEASWSFPVVDRKKVEGIAALLSRFLPCGNDHRLRRAGRILPLDRLMLPRQARHDRRVGAAALVAEASRSALATELERWLTNHADPAGMRRRVHAAAIVSCGARDGAELAAMTQADLIRIMLPDQEEPAVVPLASITSVELRRSVLGWHIGWTAPNRNPASPEANRIAFPAVAGDDCLAFFAALRQALTLLPIEANGSDLAVEDAMEDDRP